MTGRLFNTLSYRLRNELRAWSKNNKALDENTWTWYQRALIVDGNRPGRTAMALFIFMIGSALMIWGYFALLGKFEMEPVISESDINSRFYTLWTVQAAIAAMIYPIVIGFVSLLLQRRHSAKASLHVY